MSAECVNGWNSCPNGGKCEAPFQCIDCNEGYYSPDCKSEYSTKYQMHCNLLFLETGKSSVRIICLHSLDASQWIV